MAKDLLIVSYVFPPAPGIGGRRWAKFAKYLKRRDYNIQVLAAVNVTASTSEWAKDIEGIPVKYLPLRFPKIVAFPLPGLFNKIKYFASVFFLKMIYPGNYYDRSIFWKKQIQQEISKQITENKMTCVVVTSGPFRLSHYVAELKKKFPHVKFIVDFRDHWTEDSEITSFAALPPKRKAIEKKWEKETVAWADTVITTNEAITDYFASLSSENKFITLNNGFDEDDFSALNLKPSLRNDKIVFVFTGTLYINLDYIVEPFFNAIGRIKQEKNDLYQKIEFQFIGNFPAQYRKHIDKNNISEAVKIIPRLGLKEMYERITSAHFCLLLLNDVYNFSLSTKFFEYLSQKKKVIIVSSKGKSQEFVEKNNIGYSITPDNIYNGLSAICEMALDGKGYQWDSSFDPFDYSVNTLTGKLDKIIQAPLFPKKS